LAPEEPTKPRRGGLTTDLVASDEFVIMRGTTQKIAVVAGTRTVHVFGGKRVRRRIEEP
jgi:hypothetical protein